MKIKPLNRHTKTGNVRIGLPALLAVVVCIGAAFGASADGCIVSGDTSRDAAVSASSILVSPSWFDSSSFVEFITVPLSVFDSFPLGFRLIFR